MPLMYVFEDYVSNIGTLEEHIHTIISYSMKPEESVRSRERARRTKSRRVRRKCAGREVCR